MKAFRFRLQKALDLRARQLELEEAKLQQAAAALAAVDRERDGLLRGRTDAEALVRGGETITGEVLSALDAFCLRTNAEAKRIAQRRSQAVNAVEEQRRVMLEVRRRLRLLEKLKERRYAEWSAAATKEVEEMASESYLARWAVKAGDAVK